ncbi:hypothetical protein SLEP1_g16 [Rubroshorea leprosula]|uniref:Reverse transcriptase domain-containing protein n=1 Tax=Rubroshorea leprosula TaxID=152421 RepID=A0AAV5HG74_9ROSI|nr:hypothetical protein SLEP1_g16 [Rubroshorea leprosula]
MMAKFNFSTKWRAWIKECLSSATVSVLVNGSPTEEFPISKGLRQGDPLAPFLFLMVAEALNGLIQNAVELDLYKGAIVGERNFAISHLQFADDSIFFCEASTQNVWAIKCILRSFELVSGLKVNFYKSALYGINMDETELETFARKLNCVVGSIPFKYLGVLVGADQKKVSTWTPTVDYLRKKLSSWRCNNLSFGGRIVLLNSILSSIPVYYFSCYKAPKKVTNLITSIQRNFLWGGGGEDKRKIAWVSWEKICREREEGGLGVRKVELFNRVLLGKWRWRLLKEEDSLWRKVLAEKYNINRKNEWEGGPWRGSSSRWWSDLWKLDKDYNSEGWFRMNVFKVVGEGSETLFWHNIWVGNGPLKEKYDRLYRLSKDKDALISDIGDWSEREWQWRWRWRRPLFAWEHNLLQELQLELQGVQIKQGQQDNWIWKNGQKEGYSVRSAYKMLSSKPREAEAAVYTTIWNKHVPFKVTAFVWRALQHRIPTKENLFKRGVKIQNSDFSCAQCGQVTETTDHLLFECEKSWLIWTSCYNWWGIQVWSGFALYGPYGYGEMAKSFKRRQLQWKR